MEYRRLVVQISRRRFKDRLLQGKGLGFWLLAYVVVFGVLNIFLDLEWISDLVISLIVGSSLTLISYVADTFFFVPQEIYNSHSKALEAYQSKKLQLEIINLSIEMKDEQGQDVPAVEFLVINKENKKIIEFEANLLEMIVTVYDARSQMAKRAAVFQDFTANIEWLGEESEQIELVPKKGNQIIFASINDQEKTILFNPGKMTGPLFSSEAVYDLTLRLMGKLEGETEYRFFMHKAQIYAKPNAIPNSDQYDERNRLRFAEDAIDYYMDIPSKLISILKTNDLD